MAIFFFLIGLEIKRELLIGWLRSIEQAILPVIAAIGAMIVVVLLCLQRCHHYSVG
jgi:NhaA family Na+:H+ antiporter